MWINQMSAKQYEELFAFLHEKEMAKGLTPEDAKATTVAFIYRMIDSIDWID
jgi:hypothetical protein